MSIPEQRATGRLCTFRCLPPSRRPPRRRRLYDGPSARRPRGRRRATPDRTGNRTGSQELPSLSEDTRERQVSTVPTFRAAAVRSALSRDPSGSARRSATSRQAASNIDTPYRSANAEVRPNAIVASTSSTVIVSADTSSSARDRSDAVNSLCHWATSNPYRDHQLHGWRVSSVLLGAFGVVATILAAIGVYALLAFTTRQRAHEFGVRLAVGATRDAAPIECSGAFTTGWYGLWCSVSAPVRAAQFSRWTCWTACCLAWRRSTHSRWPAPRC